MSRNTLHRYERPDSHPRSRQRLARALKELVRATGDSSIGRDAKFIMHTAKAFIDCHMRGRPEPEPPTPEGRAFQAAMGEFIRAIDARAAIVRGFDDYEAEWIASAARKAVASR